MFILLGIVAMILLLLALLLLHRTGILLDFVAVDFHGVIFGAELELEHKA